MANPMDEHTAMWADEIATLPDEVEALRLIEEQDLFAADQEVAYRKENQVDGR